MHSSHISPIYSACFYEELKERDRNIWKRARREEEAIGVTPRMESQVDPRVIGPLLSPLHSRSKVGTIGRRPNGFLGFFGQSLNDRTIYSLWSYWIRQSQSDKTVFGLGRPPDDARADLAKTRLGEMSGRPFNDGFILLPRHSTFSHNE